MCVCKFSWNTDRSFPLLHGGFISLSVCATIGSRPPTMVAGPIVGEVIGDPEDSCPCADDVVLGIANPGGPPLDAPCPVHGGGGAGEKKLKCKKKCLLFRKKCL